MPLSSLCHLGQDTARSAFSGELDTEVYLEHIQFLNEISGNLWTYSEVEASAGPMAICVMLRIVMLRTSIKITYPTS